MGLGLGAGFMSLDDCDAKVAENVGGAGRTDFAFACERQDFADLGRVGFKLLGEAADTFDGDGFGFHRLKRGSGSREGCELLPKFAVIFCES